MQPLNMHRKTAHGAGLLAALPLGRFGRGAQLSWVAQQTQLVTNRSPAPPTHPCHACGSPPQPVLPAAPRFLCRHSRQQTRRPSRPSAARTAPLRCGQTERERVGVVPTLSQTAPNCTDAPAAAHLPPCTVASRRPLAQGLLLLALAAAAAAAATLLGGGDHGQALPTNRCAACACERSRALWSSPGWLQSAPGCGLAAAWCHSGPTERSSARHSLQSCSQCEVVSAMAPPMRIAAGPRWQGMQSGRRPLFREPDLSFASTRQLVRRISRPCRPLRPERPAISQEPLPQGGPAPRRCRA